LAALGQQPDPIIGLETFREVTLREGKNFGNPNENGEFGEMRFLGRSQLSSGAF